MNKKDLAKFKEYRLDSIIKLFSFNNDIEAALYGLKNTSLLSDEEKHVVEPILHELFNIDEQLRKLLISYNLNPLDFLEELKNINYEIKKVKD